jgi:hypothetical protein
MNTIEEITYLGKIIFKIENLFNNIGNLYMIGIFYYPNGYEFNPKITKLFRCCIGTYENTCYIRKDCPFDKLTQSICYYYG